MTILNPARRRVQIVLGLLWLLDGALQLQPYMFGRGFGSQIIAPAGDGQPHVVAASVTWSANLILTHPALFDIAFAVVQLLTGAAILWRRTSTLGLLASLPWALGVWWFGEAAGQLFGGQATLLTGAPGAVLLYALVAVLVLPPFALGRFALPRFDVGRVAAWAWSAVWVGGAAMRLVPSQRSGSSLADALRGAADGAPGWLAHAGDAVAGYLAHGGQAAAIALAAAFVVIAVAPHVRSFVSPGNLASALRYAGLSLGVVTSLLMWVFGQSCGQLYTGQATDPNSGPLLVVLAYVVGAATAAHHPADEVIRPSSDQVHGATLSAAA